MHACDSDAVFQAHQLGQHFCTLDDGNVAMTRFPHFRILRGAGRDVHGRAGDDDSGADSVRRGVTFKDGGAECGQAVSDGRPAQVGTGDGIAERKQDLGDTAHADAADTDKVDPLCLGEHALPTVSSCSPTLAWRTWAPALPGNGCLPWRRIRTGGTQVTRNTTEAAPANRRGEIPATFTVDCCSNRRRAWN